MRIQLWLHGEDSVSIILPDITEDQAVLLELIADRINDERRNSWDPSMDIKRLEP